MGPPNYSHIPPHPLVCVSGERPAMVADLSEPRWGSHEVCNVDSARKAYREAVDAYHASCEIPHPCKDLVSQSWKVPAWCRNYLDYCDAAEESTPRLLNNLGSDRVTHPFLDIVYYGDQWLVNDFRSANIFDGAADDLMVEALAGKKTDPVFLYPASGSHMALLLIPLKLIDRGKIRSAKLIYTEIDAGADVRIREYLEFFARPEIGLFKDLSIEKREESPGSETIYRFQYKGAPVELRFALGRGGELYARDEFIQKADVIVFHDGVYDSFQKEESIATPFLQRLSELSRAPGGKMRLLLSENEADCSLAPAACYAREQKLPMKTLDGFYACNGEHFRPEEIFTYRSPPPSKPRVVEKVVSPAQDGLGPLIRYEVVRPPQGRLFKRKVPENFKDPFRVSFIHWVQGGRIFQGAALVAFPPQGVSAPTTVSP